MANVQRGEKGTWRSRIRVSRDLIFLCGQRGIPNSLHFLFSTVSPIFKFLEASTIGRSKYLARSANAILAIRSVAALFFFTIKPAIFQPLYEWLKIYHQVTVLIYYMYTTLYTYLQSNSISNIASQNVATCVLPYSITSLNRKTLQLALNHMYTLPISSWNKTNLWVC